MNVLIVEDDKKIKEEVIDDCLASLGHNSDWAQNQQEANVLLAATEYDLILLDLQIPSRPGGKDLPEFGRNLLKQIRDNKGRDVPVILMTAQHQDCVDLMTDLHEIGLDASISKPFPDTGRTLAVVIEGVLDKHRRCRKAPPETNPEKPNWSRVYSKKEAAAKIGSGISVDTITARLKKFPQSGNKINRQMWRFDKNDQLFSGLESDN